MKNHTGLACWVIFLHQFTANYRKLAHTSIIYYMYYVDKTGRVFIAARLLGRGWGGGHKGRVACTIYLSYLDTCLMNELRNIIVSVGGTRGTTVTCCCRYPPS